MAVADEIITDEVNPNKDHLEGILVSLMGPEKYGGKDGMEVKYLLGYEDLCVQLSQNISQDPKKMTTLAFYRAVEVLTKKDK